MTHDPFLLTTDQGTVSPDCSLGNQQVVGLTYRGVGESLLSGVWVLSSFGHSGKSSSRHG